MDENNSSQNAGIEKSVPETENVCSTSYSYKDQDHVTGVVGPGTSAGYMGSNTPYATNSGGQSPQPPLGGPKPKHHGPGKWITRCLALLLVAAVAFGSGYAGIQLGNNNLAKVVIQQATNTSSGSDSDSLSTDTASALSAEQISDKVIPSVVAITTEAMTTSNYWFGSQVLSGAGSGVIISSDGYILTNNHVINGADSIKVELNDGTSYTATVVGTYPKGDIAVIKIDATGLTPATFADSDTVDQGAVVYAVGNPEGTFSSSITSGIISGTNRKISVSVDDSNSSSNNPFGTSSSTVNLTVFQFDAAVSPGNSGGGLFNSKGELIGIVCAKSSDTESEGLGFAIVGNKAKEIATSLISTGSYTSTDEDSSDSGTTTNTNKAILGVSVIYLDDATAQKYGYTSAGLYIASITQESTLKAGLAVGDRIISVDDVVVTKSTDVTDYLANKNPGDKVSVSVERSGKMLTCEVTLVENTNS